MNINFDSDMYKKLQAKATEQHTTITALIKELVIKHVLVDEEKNETKKTKAVSSN